MKSLSMQRTVAVVALMLVAILLSACNAAQAKDPIALVPDQAEVLASIDLPAILSDEDVHEFYELLAETSGDESMPPTIEDALAMAQEETGLDLSTFGDVLVFVDIPAEDVEAMDAGTVDYVGVIAAGAPDNLFETVQENAEEEMTESEYKGVNLLEATDGSMALAVVSDSVVLGSPQAVRDVIDVAEGDASAIGGDLVELYDELGDVWAKAVVVLPQELKDQMGDANAAELGLPVDAAALMNIDVLGISANKAENDGTLRVVLRYPTEAEATDSAEVLESLVTLAKTFGGDDPALDSLDALVINVEGTDVVVEYTQDLQEAMDQFRETMESTRDMTSLGVGY